METSKNRASLRGQAQSAPHRSHANHGIEYWVFPIEVARLSGVIDTLNVVVSTELLEACPVLPGEEYQVTGEIRSFNNRSGVGSRLVITFFARTLEKSTGEPVNQLELTGVLCRKPVFRHTPLGREICDLLLAVNRRYGRTDYLPCIAWGGIARACGNLAVGDAIHITGRLQSRKYRKMTDGQEEERTAYEISIMSTDAPDE